MAYCTKCGNEIADEAIICPKCGCTTSKGDRAYNNGQTSQSSGLKTAAKVFMIIGTVSNGCLLLPLAWCLPMTISYFNKVKNRQPVSMAFKICSLLFVNMIAGILMLCDSDDLSF